MAGRRRNLITPVNRPFVRRSLALAATLGLMLLVSCGAQADSQSEKATQALQLDGKTFKLELALTPRARYVGLGGREHIDPRGGMLFVFPGSAVRHFVMRDCKVPIDLIFLNRKGEVVRMHQMPVPEDPSNPRRRYSSFVPAQFAIELKGGMLDKLDIERGDQIAFPREALKRRAE